MHINQLAYQNLANDSYLWKSNLSSPILPGPFEGAWAIFMAPEGEGGGEGGGGRNARGF